MRIQPLWWSTHGLVCRALVERHALVPEGISIPERFDNTSVTGLHEGARREPDQLHSASYDIAEMELAGAPA